MKLLESWSTVYTSNSSESLTVYLLVANGSKSYNNICVSMYVDVCKVAQIYLKRWKPSTQFLHTLKELYILLGLVLTGFRCLGGSSDMMSGSKVFYDLYRCFFLINDRLFFEITTK